MQLKDISELFSLMKEKLYTPVVGDILDGMGYYHQFLPPEIRPMTNDMKIAGKAMTVLMIDVFGEQAQPSAGLPNASIRFRKMRFMSAPAAPSAVPTGESCSPQRQGFEAARVLFVIRLHRDTPWCLSRTGRFFRWVLMLRILPSAPR